MALAAHLFVAKVFSASEIRRETTVYSPDNFSSQYNIQIDGDSGTVTLLDEVHPDAAPVSTRADTRGPNKTLLALAAAAVVGLVVWWRRRRRRR